MPKAGPAMLLATMAVAAPAFCAFFALMAAKNINSIKELKGKTVAASAPGTAPYFTLAWMLRENGLNVKDVKVVNLEPQAAANAMIAGTDGIDAAMTYEPYLGAVRAKPEDLPRFHVTNERITEANLVELIRFYHRLVQQAAG